MTVMNQVRARALLFAAIAALPLAGCDIFTSTDTRLERGERLLAQGAYTEAIVELKNALDAEPQNTRALLGVTRASLQLGRLDAAEQTLAGARAAGAPAAEIATLQADLHLARGEYDKLLAQLDGGSLALSEDARAEYRMRVASATGDCARALPAARALLAKDANRSPARVALAECLARRGNFEGARSELEAAVAHDEADAGAWIALGRLRQLRGDRRGAEQAWRTAAKHAAGKLSVPQQTMMYTALAQFEIERGELAALRNTRTAVLAVAPGSAVAEYLGANVDLLDGKTDAAVATLQRLVAADEKFGPGRLLLTSALLAQEKFEQARKQLASLVNDLPNSTSLGAAAQVMDKLAPATATTAEHWVRVAFVHAALEQPAMARAALERALAIDPKSRDAAIGLAQVELRVGDNAGALRRATELAQSAPDELAVAMLLANAQSANGDHAAAVATLEKLHAQAPKASLALAIHKERREGALGDANLPLERWLAQHPRDRVMRFALAEALRAAGDNRRAAAEFEILIQQEPRDVAALNNLAWTYYLLHDKRAVGVARRAFEQAPKVASIADTYGWLLVESGSVSEGVEILKAADAAEGAIQPEIRFHHAAALARAGEKDQARVMLDDLAANAGDFPSQSEAAALLRTLTPDAAT